MTQALRFILGCLLSLLLGSAPAWAAISVLQGTAEGLTGNGSLTPSPASGTLSGDLLIAQIISKSSVTVTAPTGWTLITTASYSSTSVKQRIYYLNLSSAPADSYTWTISNGSGYRAAAAIYTVRGAATADCGSANTTNCAGSYQSGSGSSITAPNVHQTFGAGSLRLAFFASNNASLTIMPALENSATEGQYLRAGSGTTGVGMDASYYLLTGDSDGGQQSATLSNSADQIGSSLVIAAGALSLTCVSDDFNRTTGLGSNWVSSVVNGSFTPAIVNNRLQMTNTGAQESTAVTFQRLFPGTSNYIQLTFKYYAYGGTTTGADGMAVILSDASVTPQAGGFGGSLGYAPKSATGASGFAGGWLGLGLDEYGNFSNKNDSGACATTATSCATSRVSQSVSIRGSTSNYYWLAGTGTLGTTVSNNTGHMYRVTVDSRTSGQAMVSVERDTSGAGTSYSTLINSFNALSTTSQAAIPSNFILSLTGSTGDLTNTHEIDDLKVCAQTMNSMTSINHYRFAINTALTCTPAAVTVTACMDADCTTTYTAGNVTATLTATTSNSNDGWVAGATQTFASGSTLYLRETTAGTYSIGVSASSPVLTAYSVGAQCSINGSTYSTANCSKVTFSDAGLLLTVPTQKSGVTSNSSDGTLFSVSAVKKGSTSRDSGCIPAFASVSRNVKFWSGYENPATGTKTLAVNGTTIGTSSSTATSLALSFDATGTASGLYLNYLDAGQISLNATYSGSTATSDAGLAMTVTGSSSFVVVPYKLCVDSTASNWNCAVSQTLAQTPTNCSVFTTAGTAFNLRVTGKAYSSSYTDVCAMPTTPNYIQSSVPLSSAVFAPTGGSAGSLSASTISIPSGGTATVSTSESEVGDFTLSAGPATYLGVTGPTGSAVFGRFIPAGFTASGSLTNRSDLTCASSFTYLGEPLKAAVTLTAVNATGSTTTNYVGNFARLNLAPVTTAGSDGLAFGVQDGTTLLNSRLSASCTSCPAFASGATALNTTLTVTRAASYGIDGPYTAAIYGLVATDADVVGMFNPNFSWGLTSTSNGLSLGSTRLYFGRMRVENAYGSPALPLQVPAYAQFWNGTTFVKSLSDGTTDSCTQLTVPSSSVIDANTAPALYCTGGLGMYGSNFGVTVTLNKVTAGNLASLVSGDAGLLLSKPVNGSGGYLDLALSVPDYLKYNWDPATACSTLAGGSLHDDNPRARIRFGIRRNDKIIYLREVY
ncbi:MAG: hypothetical protein H6R19_1377 [Proteobacteria bacterium]|nr:hypothetical protein [Pseudomonadota bacterium]